MAFNDALKQIETASKQNTDMKTRTFVTIFDFVKSYYLSIVECNGDKILSHFYQICVLPKLQLSQLSS